MGELAHIIAHGDEGPRADRTVGASARDDIENIIVLCPTCHTIVDKAPDAFPPQLLIDWKREHAGRIKALFAVQRFATRNELGNAVGDLMRKNRAIHRQYGPARVKSPYHRAVDAKIWKDLVKLEIVPNNKRILALLDANAALLSVAEKEVVEAFRLHAGTVERRHFFGTGGESSLRFPVEMDRLLEDLSGEYI